MKEKLVSRISVARSCVRAALFLAGVGSSGRRGGVGKGGGADRSRVTFAPGSCGVAGDEYGGPSALGCVDGAP